MGRLSSRQVGMQDSTGLQRTERQERSAQARSPKQPQRKACPEAQCPQGRFLSSGTRGSSTTRPWRRTYRGPTRNMAAAPPTSPPTCALRRANARTTACSRSQAAQRAKRAASSRRFEHSEPACSHVRQGAAERKREDRVHDHHLKHKGPARHTRSAVDDARQVTSRAMVSKGGCRPAAWTVRPLLWRVQAPTWPRYAPKALAQRRRVPYNPRSPTQGSPPPPSRAHRSCSSNPTTSRLRSLNVTHAANSPAMAPAHARANGAQTTCGRLRGPPTPRVRAAAALASAGILPGARPTAPQHSKAPKGSTARKVRRAKRTFHTWLHRPT